MPIRPLDEWVSSRPHLTQTLPLSALKGAVVGIDASHYISQHLLQPSFREPLLVALGGFPFALRNNIERELQLFKEIGVACVFVFDGLDFGTKNQRPSVQPEAVQAFERAWDLYDQQQADQVVDAFSGAGTPRPHTLYRFLQRILHDHNIDYIVAPYSAAAQVLISQPVGVEDSEIYRQVVGSILTPIQTQSICLLSNSLHRFYQTKVIHVRPWYDEKSDTSINLKTIPSVRETIQSWKIRTDQLPEGLKKLQASSGPFRFAVQSLKDSDFATKSLSLKDSQPLSSQEEILSNVFWRFLQLRGYITEKHQLTPWGVCLEQALSVLDPSDGLEEATFLAIEMLRLGLLNSKPWFSHVSGGPMRGSDEDKSFNMLVSRVACVAKLQHKSIGYSGPLSRQLLCYRSLIAAVRSTLRNLIEVILTGLLLNGDADRNRNDWSDLSVKLPFIDDNDCGLGIAVRTYLDDLPLQADPTSPDARTEVKSKGKDWFQHSESFTGNLDLAFKLWDAVYKGTQNAGREVKDAKVWATANQWLEQRR
ncbi:temperature dependent protein affecting M2 dsRNA replication-domain-containing protein [Aspergillus candidus]|uniref:Temperature dependent protein affecting M2 dsRNA replication-domain-containing protein n=1 Tax=Aspergillus candidus TaxID=41067 RepID=A0A2I2FBW7_ASPCN|nr:temperature dependent protein affecting M2 dsRNA replication-domain-containing protein [Aspergillus candidus]PLB38128.1 temperature dependent protein affecting M2 dsRNA replication-domain-containing protein [Aspergillus candidus]